MKSHDLIDQRSLAFDRLIVEKLHSEPKLIGRAQKNISRWLLTSSPNVHPILQEWQKLLDGSFEELITVMLGTDEHATQLRQSSPFCGILTPEERTRILLEFQNYESLPTRAHHSGSGR